MPQSGVSVALLAALLISWAAAPVAAATLPPHGPLRVLVISDEVNPNNLSDAQLTQRGDISTALNAADSGLKLEGSAKEVYSQCVDDALTALNSAQPPQVLIYFAHRSALGCDQSDRQAALTAAFEAHLKRGGGIVVFHHGGYTWPGKEALMPLLGVSASSISWNTSEGQRVFNVAPGHFVTSNGVVYSGRAALTAMGAVPAGMFDYFDNIPDERYPSTALLTETGETRTILFATSSGGTRVLGYALERAGWQGRVLFYQPAEYQPHALDDRAGPNFQILANAIVYSVHQEGGGSGGSGGPSGAGGASDSAASAGSAAAGVSGAAAQPDSAGIGNSATGGTSSGSSFAGSNPAGGSSATPGAGNTGAGSSTTGGTSAGGASTSPASTSPPASDSGGCGCRLSPPLGPTRSAAGALLLTTLGFLGRRRKSARTVHAERKMGAPTRA